MKRAIIFLHRWIGIPMSLVFVVWFISGVVMMYTGDMPTLTNSDRLQGLGPVDFAAVELSPAAAAGRTEIGGDISTLSLRNLLGRPAYSVSRGFGPPTRVFADTGEIFSGASDAEILAEAARFVGQPVDALRFAGTVTEPDQWTLGITRSLPLERFDVQDGRATRVYISKNSGQVELVTDRRSRALAWAGAIPHWFYITALRTHQAAWYRTVVWVAGIGCVMAVLGLILAVTQFRRSKPFRLSASIRYRGWMRWHYYTGALFGLFALTWVFSGLMSMEPFAWTNATGMRLPGNNLQGGALELDRYPITDPRFVGVAGPDVAEIELKRIQGEPYFALVRLGPTATLTRELIDTGSFAVRGDTFPVEAILAELKRTVTEADVIAYDVLDDYDPYYYAQDDQLPLPVLRVKFDDPAATWYYFDLTTNATLGSTHHLGRIERWLFNGLHSLDFGFWYDRRPLWDIGLILLSLGALATSGIGLYLGVRRLAGLARKPVRQAG